MPVLIPAGAFAQQVHEVAKKLHGLSDRVEIDDDEGTPRRATSYLVELVDPVTGITATFDYREEFTRTPAGWLRAGYVYELRLSQPFAHTLDSRRGHHEHEPLGIHQHCETPARADDHYADVERLLLATHELFVMQVASRTAIDCAGLVPLTG